MFELKPNGRQCLREEVQKDVLVTGEYEISEVPGQRTDIKVINNYSLLFLHFINVLHYLGDGYQRSYVSEPRGQKQRQICIYH